MLKNNEKISLENFFIIMFGQMKKVFKIRHLVNNIYENTNAGEKKIQRLLKNMVNKKEIILNSDTKSYTSNSNKLNSLLKNLSLYDIAHFNSISTRLSQNGINFPSIQNVEFINIANEFSKILPSNRNEQNQNNYFKILGAISSKENITFTYKKRHIANNNYQELKVVSPLKIIMYKNNVYFSGIEINDSTQTIKLYEINRISDMVNIQEIKDKYINIQSSQKIKIKYQLNNELPEKIQKNIQFEYNMNSFILEAEVSAEYEILIRRQIENEKAYIHNQIYYIFIKIK